MKKQVFLSIAMVFIIAGTYGQMTVSDDPGYTPSSSNTLFEVYSKDHNKGILVPRMTTLQRLGITPNELHDRGLLVYDTDLDRFFYFSNRWEKIENSLDGWSATGNTGTDSLTNFIGTSDEFPLIFKTHGVERMRIGKNGGISITGSLLADSATINGPLIVSGDGGSFGFFGNSMFPCSPNLTTDLMKVTTDYFTVKGANNNWTTAPLKGMGVNWQCPIPGNMLDVYDGAINVFSPTNIAVGYKIGDRYVLRHKGNVTNLYVGVDAGLANTVGNDNTIMGFGAASTSPNIGGMNTIIGSGAGINITGTVHYTLVGYNAGFFNPGGVTNTLIGSEAGYSDLGDENVYIGWKAGYNNNAPSYHNVFVGNLSGFNNMVGNNNVFVGITSGIQNIAGNDNVALGAGAGPGSGFLNNSIAIGGGAQVMNSDQMILGTIPVNVGIGLSGDASGPQNKLEIDAGLNGTLPVPGGVVGASGLRFRDLHAATLTIPNPGPGYLSVDANGDVIYVDRPSSGGGSVTICNTPPPPINNVVKLVAPNTLCETNITDLFPTNNVGINFPNPNDGLDVGAGTGTGHIDINNPISAYKINDLEMMWHKGSTSNTFLGIDAAFSHMFNKNSYNTILGSRAMYNGNGQTPPNFQTNMRNTVIGYEAGYNFNANGAVFIGYQAGYTQNSIFGTANVFVGFQSGYSNQGGAEDNTFYGTRSGYSNTWGDQNCFIGLVSGENNTTGGYNTFVGLGSGRNNGVFNFNTFVGANSGGLSQGSENTFMGYNSGSWGVGDFNVVLGAEAMTAATSGDDNTVVGYKANFVSLGTSNNTLVGSRAAFNNTTGADNTYIGYKSAFNQTAGRNNAYLGFNTGINMVGGSDNTLLGGSADATNPNSTLSNASAIGANALVSNSNHMILGDNNVNVGIGLSGDPTGPQNKLEINTGIPSTSGLRFRNLTSATIPGANPGTGVLGVDPNGDVIYVSLPPSGPGGSLGNVCSLPQNPLPADYEIPLNTFNFNFSGDGVVSDKVNIGYICGSAPPGKLNVTTAFQSSAAPNESYSVYATNTTATSTKHVGVYGEASTGANLISGQIGVWGKATGGRGTIGVYGEGGSSNPILGGATGGKFEAVSPNIANIGASGYATGGTSYNSGVEGEARFGATAQGGLFQAWGGTTSNIGVIGRAFPTLSMTNPITVPVGISVGVYGHAPWSNPPASIDYAGYFDGDVWINGPISGTGFALTSDEMFKRNVSSIEDALGVLSHLNPKSYYFDQTNSYGMHFSNKKQYGLVAQDVEKVLPELVYENRKPAMADSAGNVVFEGVTYKSIDYNAFTALLIKAVQELQEQNARQDAMIRELTSLLDSKVIVKNDMSKTHK